MIRLNRFLIFSLFNFVFVGCGGGAPPKPSTPPAETPAESDPSATGADKQGSGATPACQRPIGGPGEVWPRIEAARAMSDDELVAKCGLPFIEEVSGWRPPPVDLLEKIVAGAKAEGTLDAWVKEKFETDPRLAEHVVGIDIIGAWEIGLDTATITASAASWQNSLGDQEVVQKAVTESEQVTAMLPRVTEVHELRCRLEVNPLGFAVDCDPIHPAKEKIDLNWKAKMRDGLLEDLALTRCEISKNCKELEETAAKLKTTYLGLMQDVEKLEVEIFKEQMKAWMALPPFK